MKKGMIFKRLTLCLFLILVVLSLFLFNFTSAIQITQFNNSLSSENITFTGDENITRYLNISKYANVTSAYLNLSGYISDWNLSIVIYESNFSVFPQLTRWSAFDLFFKPDGTGFYIVEPVAHKVHQYSLSTPWDILSSSYVDSYTINELGNTYGLFFKPDGTKMYVVGEYPDMVFQYSLSTAWNVTTASYESNFSVAEEPTPYDVFFKPDGTEMYIMGSWNTDVFQYSLSTPWDITSSVYFGRSWVSPSCDGGLFFKPDGTNFYCMNIDSPIFQYSLSTPWDITSSSSYVNNFSFSSYDSQMLGLFFKPDGTKMYAIGLATYRVYQYIFTTYSTNPYLEIGTLDGTYEWNHTGEFNSTFSPNKTSDFSSTLNSALNSGACDCTGCSLDGDNCIIPFLFHSDTAGKLEYSTIDINYIPAPSVNLVSPDNNTWSSSIRTFNCSTTDEIQLSNITFYFWNSTGDLNLSTTINLTGTSNSTTYDMIFNSTDTWTWGCSAYNNNSRSWWADNNFTINVNVDNPIITLNKPTDEQYVNTANVQFNYTPEHSTQTVDTCELYGNFTGTWHLNQTNTTITEDIVNSFNQTLLEGITYLWNIWCNTTETGNSAFSDSNFTFTIDLTNPIVSINSITTTAGSQTISVNSTQTDTNLDTCKYSIFNSIGDIDGLNENVSFICNAIFPATVTAYGSYNLTIYGIDLASNENSDTLEFTTSASVGGVVSGGGGEAITIVQAKDFTITTTNFLKNMDIGLAKDSTKPRKKAFYITNKGVEEITISLECNTVDVNESSRGINICDYVTILNDSITILPSEEIREIGYFEVMTPEDAEFGDKYYFNILAKEGETTVNVDKLSVSTRVSLLSMVYKWKGKEGRTPIAGISIVIAIILFTASLIFFSKIKKLGVGSIISVIILIGSFFLFLFIL